MKTAVLTILICVIAFELVEHLILPFLWYIFKGRKKSAYGVTGMIGKVAEIKRWHISEGQVLINGELWRAVCEVPQPVGGKAMVCGIDGLTLKLKPCQN